MTFMFSATWLSPLLFRRDTGDILLKICNVMPQDTGIYTCVAVNDHGSASSSASIKVQGPIPISVGLWFRPFQDLWSSTCFVRPAGIPAAPGRPVAQEASISAVMVHWAPPALSTHCAVSSYSVEYRQEGVCVCVYGNRGRDILCRNLSNGFNCFLSLPVRLVAVAAGGQQQGGVRSDRRSHPRGALPVQGTSIQPLGCRPAVWAIQYGDAVQH